MGEEKTKEILICGDCRKYIKSDFYSGGGKCYFQPIYAKQYADKVDGMFMLELGKMTACPRHEADCSFSEYRSPEAKCRFGFIEPVDVEKAIQDEKDAERNHESGLCRKCQDAAEDGDFRRCPQCPSVKSGKYQAGRW